MVRSGVRVGDEELEPFGGWRVLSGGWTVTDGPQTDFCEESRPRLKGRRLRLTSYFSARLDRRPETVVRAVARPRLPPPLLARRRTERFVGSQQRLSLGGRE